jgi:hypothetical protein
MLTVEKGKDRVLAQRTMDGAGHSSRSKTRSLLKDFEHADELQRQALHLVARMASVGASNQPPRMSDHTHSYITQTRGGDYSAPKNAIPSDNSNSRHRCANRMQFRRMLILSSACLFHRLCSGRMPPNECLTAPVPPVLGFLRVHISGVSCSTTSWSAGLSQLRATPTATSVRVDPIHFFGVRVIIDTAVHVLHGWSPTQFTCHVVPGCICAFLNECLCAG